MTLEQLQQAYAELEQTHIVTCNELQAVKDKLAKTSLEAESGNIARQMFEDTLEYINEVALTRQGDTMNLLKSMRDVIEVGGKSQDVYAKIYTLISQTMENVNLLYDGLESIADGDFDYLAKLKELALKSWGF